MANQRIIRCKISNAPAKQAIVYWRKKSSGQPVVNDGVAKLAVPVGMGDFIFSGNEAARLLHFIKTEYGVQPEVFKIKGKKDLVKHAVLLKKILKGNPGIWQIPGDATIYSVFDQEIEGVYAGHLRQALLQQADEEAIESVAKIIRVTPVMKLEAVTPERLLGTSPKFGKIWQVLKDNIPEHRLDFIVNSSVLARPPLTDGANKLLSGVADCLRAEALGVEVSCFPVQEKIEESERLRAFVQDIMTVARIPSAALGEIVRIYYEDLQCNTGRARGAVKDVNLARRASKELGISENQAERYLAIARQSQGLKQKKTYASAPAAKTRNIEDAVEKCEAFIQETLDKFASETTFLQNRLRGRIKKTLSALCKKLKEKKGKSKGAST